MSQLLGINSFEGERLLERSLLGRTLEAGDNHNRIAYILYGSAALGYLTPASDIDILRIVPGGDGTPKRTDGYLGPHPVSLYTISRSDLERDAFSGEYGGYYALKLLNPIHASERYYLRTLRIPLQFFANIGLLDRGVLNPGDIRATVRLMIKSAILMYPPFASSLAAISNDPPAWQRYWEVQDRRLRQALTKPIRADGPPTSLEELRCRFYQHGAEMHSYGNRFHEVYNSKAESQIVDEILGRLQ